jgi:UDP-glucose 4-epimerase
LHVLVTGAAGFIGSHVGERCLERGHRVTALDSFHPYYPREVKERNAAALRRHPSARFLETDLARDDLSEALSGVEAVVHLAAQPGVRGSWGTQFSSYLDANVLATQRLLEASAGRGLAAFVYGSSASVYGDVEGPVTERDVPAPHSPYGVTKLAGEHLAMLYGRNRGLPVVSLRYFSVYGPRERPDKAIQRFLVAARDGGSVRLHGDGSQRRDFTYVADAVDATLSALERPPVGRVVNVARGRTVALSEVLDVVSRVTGRRLSVERGPPEAGDVRTTSADVSLARDVLGHDPRTDLEAGIRRQWEHVSSRKPSG